MVTEGGAGSGVFYTEGVASASRSRAGDACLRAARSYGADAHDRHLGTSVADAIKPGPEWNTYHIIAHHTSDRGLHQRADGRDAGRRQPLRPSVRAGCLLALQMHSGQPFAIEFKNVYLREIKAENLTALPPPADKDAAAATETLRRGGEARADERARRRRFRPRITRMNTDARRLPDAARNSRASGLRPSWEVREIRVASATSSRHALAIRISVTSRRAKRAPREYAESSRIVWCLRRRRSSVSSVRSVAA